MSADQPFFRFHPHAYDAQRGLFAASDDPCGICGEPCVWRYAGPIYTRLAPETCARCLASGALKTCMRERWGETHFAFHDAQVEGVDPALAEEVLQATPGFATYNPIDWPVIDGMPLAYIGHGDEAVVRADPQVVAAIARAELEAFGDASGSPSPYAVAFREIDGDRYVVIFDYD